MPAPHEIILEDEHADAYADAEFALWHVYDAGVPMLRLKVRYRDDVEVPDWQHGPDFFTALQDAETQGWQVYDREPGNAPGEYAILHLIRAHQ